MKRNRGKGSTHFQILHTTHRFQFEDRLRVIHILYVQQYGHFGFHEDGENQHFVGCMAEVAAPVCPGHFPLCNRRTFGHSQLSLLRFD